MLALHRPMQVSSLSLGNHVVALHCAAWGVLTPLPPGNAPAWLCSATSHVLL
jgi:hypothetical protein